MQKSKTAAPIHKNISQTDGAIVQTTKIKIKFSKKTALKGLKQKYTGKLSTVVNDNGIRFRNTGSNIINRPF